MPNNEGVISIPADRFGFLNQLCKVGKQKNNLEWSVMSVLNIT